MSCQLLTLESRAEQVLGQHGGRVGGRDGGGGQHRAWAFPLLHLLISWPGCGYSSSQDSQAAAHQLCSWRLAAEDEEQVHEMAAGEGELAGDERGHHGYQQQRRGEAGQQLGRGLGGTEVREQRGLQLQLQPGRQLGVLQPQREAGPLDDQRDEGEQQVQVRGGGRGGGLQPPAGLPAGLQPPLQHHGRQGPVLLRKPRLQRGLALRTQPGQGRGLDKILNLHVITSPVSGLEMGAVLVKLLPFVLAAGQGCHLQLLVEVTAATQPVVVVVVAAAVVCGVLRVSRPRSRL